MYKEERLGPSIRQQVSMGMSSDPHLSLCPVTRVKALGGGAYRVSQIYIPFTLGICLLTRKGGNMSYVL